MDTRAAGLSDLSTGASLASRPATATCARVRQSAPERDCGAAAQGRLGGVKPPLGRQPELPSLATVMKIART